MFADKKLSDEVLVWQSVWSEMQMICIVFSWCLCHPLISCFIKVQIGLTFLCWLTQIVLEKRPRNRCLSVFADKKWGRICWDCATSRTGRFYTV